MSERDYENEPGPGRGRIRKSLGRGRGGGRGGGRRRLSDEDSSSPTTPSFGGQSPNFMRTGSSSQRRGSHDHVEEPWDPDSLFRTPSTATPDSQSNTLHQNWTGSRMGNQNVNFANQNISRAHSEPQLQRNPQAQDQSRQHPRTANQGATPPKQHIKPKQNIFEPYEAVKKRVGEIWRGRYNQPWPSWQHVPYEERQIWFDELRKIFYWNPEDEHRIRTNFYALCSKCIGGVLYDARRKKEKPDWIVQSVWDGLLKAWDSLQYKAMCKKNRECRLSDPEGMGPAKHCGGSIPYAVRFDNYVQEHGCEPTVEQFYLYNHQNKNGKFADPKSQKTYENFQERWAEYMRTHDVQTPLTFEELNRLQAKLWIEGNLDRNGRVYGMGSEAQHIKSLAGLKEALVKFDPRELAMGINQGFIQSLRQQWTQDMNDELDRREAAMTQDDQDDEVLEVDPSGKEKKAQGKGKKAASKPKKKGLDRKQMRQFYNCFKSQVPGSSQASQDEFERVMDQMETHQEEQGEEEEEEEEDD